MSVVINDFCTINNGLLRFSRAQASRFAKEVAGDFNPIHDIEAKRFCVPGDLLVAILLTRYGMAESTRVDYLGMVGDGVSIDLPESIEDSYTLTDHRERDYLTITCKGQRTTDEKVLQTLIQEYCQFSGKTFPDILVALMQKHNVMINPNRPLVMYQNMELHFEKPASAGMQLHYDGSNLELDGKKAVVNLEFSLHENNEKLGAGKKVMLLGGLREYEQSVMDEVVATYAEWKANYTPFDKEH